MTSARVDVTSLRRHSDVVDLTQYVNELQHQLLVAADSGGEEARLLAERLVAPLQSATRLVLLDALSAAASEITRDVAPGSVEVRLRGRDPEFVVTLPVVDSPGQVEATSPDLGPSGSGGPVGEGEDGGTARVTLRLPEPLKLRIEEVAGREGLSVNSWLVRTLAGVVQPTERGTRTGPRRPSSGDRFTGWARS
jgi:hypothetical protein